MTSGGKTYFYHLNARGDVVAMSDESGAIVNTYSYDPWGAPLSAHESVPNPYRYASYRYDAATGLYYCWNRYYAPALARFLTRDIYPGELSDPVTLNPYLYCGADPVNAVDPSGMWVVAGGLGYQVGCLTIGWSQTRSIASDGAGFGDYMTQGGLVTLPCEGGAGFSLSLYSADSLNEIEGASSRFGVSFGSGLGGSVDICWNNDCVGLVLTSGLAARVPAAVHFSPAEETRYLPPTMRNISARTVDVPGVDTYARLRSVDY